MQPLVGLDGDAVDGVQERLGAGFDAVGRDAAAAVKLVIVDHFDVDFGLRVLAHGDRLNAEVAADDGDAGQFFDRQKDRIDRPIAGFEISGVFRVAVP